MRRCDTNLSVLDDEICSMKLGTTPHETQRNVPQPDFCSDQTLIAKLCYATRLDKYSKDLSSTNAYLSGHENFICRPSPTPPS